MSIGSRQGDYRSPTKSNLKSKSSRRSLSKDHALTDDNCAATRNPTLKPPPPVPTLRKAQIVPSYSFLASLYLDGRSMPEQQVIIYTDPTHEDFHAPDGKVILKHRRVQSEDGTMTEHAWLFKGKAIETAFNRLAIHSSHARIEGQDEDAMIEAMKSTGFDQGGGLGDYESKVGQIVIELRRVVLGQRAYDPHYRSKHQEGQEEDTDMDVVDPKLAHATGLTYSKTIAPAPVLVVHWSEYKIGEGTWATFHYFYRSAGQYPVS